MLLVARVLVRRHDFHDGQLVEQVVRIELRIRVVDKHIYEISQRHINTILQVVRHINWKLTLR